MITTYQSTVSHRPTGITGRELLYAEPQEYFVEVQTSRGDEHFFTLPMPGVVFTAQKYNHTYGDFYMYLVHEDPFTTDKQFKPGTKFYAPPLPHIMDDGRVCMHPYSMYEGNSMMDSFVYFWNSKATYWTSYDSQKYIESNYPADLTQGEYHPEIADVQYFKIWEEQYSVDTISTAPFCKKLCRALELIDIQLRTPKVLVQ